MQPTNYPTRIDLCDGKYTVIYNLDTGQSECLRYGEKWRDLLGDKMILAMFDRIVELEAKNSELTKDMDRLYNVAHCGSVDSFLKCDEEVRRGYFAMMVSESSDNKKLREQVAEMTRIMMMTGG